MRFAADGERDQLRGSGFRVPGSEADHSDFWGRSHPIPLSDWESGFHGHFIQVPSKANIDFLTLPQKILVSIIE